jgi:uncharacterized protein YegL
MVCAQKFEIGDIETDNFPEVKTLFYLLDNQGNNVELYDKSDFKVYENGIEVNSEVIEDIECEIDYTPVQVLLTLDVSSSMNEDFDGKTKIDWAKEALTELINELGKYKYVQIGITVFSGRVELIQDFTNDTDLLLSALDKISYHQSTTDFNLPFFDKTFGAEVLFKKVPNFNRTMVFLTDGRHDDEWRGGIRRSEIISLLNKNEIKLHTVTVDDFTSGNLLYILRATGGVKHEVRSGKETLDLYAQLAKDMAKPDINYCEIMWLSKVDCADSARYTDLKVIYEPYSLEKYTEYNAPVIVDFQNGIGYSSLYFGNPEPGNGSTKTITIKPYPYDFEISDISLDDETYFEIIDYGFDSSEKPDNFTVPAGNTHSIQVKFTQINEDVPRQANLILGVYSCEQVIELTGGRGELEITNPYDSQCFARCDEVEIRWTGVLPEAKTDLYYSEADNISWQPLASDITGLSYFWSPNWLVGRFLVKAVSEVENGNGDLLEAISDTFNLINPVLEVLEKDLQHDNLTVGDDKVKTFVNIARNNTLLPINIIDYYFEGSAGSDYMVETLSSTTILPGDSISAAISFMPEDKGFRNVDFVLVTDCNSKALFKITGEGICEISSTDTLDFEDVYLDDLKDSVFTHVFTNHMSMPVTITCRITGDDAGDFYLVDYWDGKKITIKPYSHYDVRMIFNPTTLGEKTADLLLISEECGYTETVLLGNSVRRGVEVNDLDFGRKLYKSNFDTLQMEVINLDRLPIIIENIDWGNDGSSFSIINGLPELPFELAGRDTLRFKIVFNPDVVGKLESKLNFVLTDEDDVYANVIGETYLPELTVEPVCPSLIEVGESGVAKLLIINSSTTEKLRVDKIYLIDGFDEFSVIDTLPLPENINIGIGDTITAYLNYAPIQSGTHTAEVSIWANNYDGEFKSDSKENFAFFNCDILDFSMVYDNYSRLVVCETDTLDVKVYNKNETSSLKVFLSQATGFGEVDFYSLIDDTDIMIKPLDSAMFSFLVKPLTRGSFSSNWIIPTDISKNINLDLSVDSYPYTLSMVYDTISYSPEDLFEQIIELEIPETENGYIEDITLEVDYDNLMCNINESDITSLISEDENEENYLKWDIGLDKINGKIIGSAKGKLISNNQYKLLKINANGLLPISRMTEFNCKLFYNCSDDFEKAISYIKLNPNCSGDLRFVEFTGYNFTCSEPYPNPNSGEIKIDFSIAYEFRTTIELYSVDGKKVSVLLDEVLETGRHNKTLLLDNLIPAGSYILVFTCNDFVQSFPMRIER